MFNYWDTVEGQYQKGPIRSVQFANLNEYIDPRADYQAFYDAEMNIDTASGYGLDVWGRIVGVQRVIQIPLPNPSFGFAEEGSAVSGFAESVAGGTGSFGDYIESATQPYTLLDNDFRQLILAKAAYNITNGSIPAINQLLLNLFPGRGNVYVTDDGGMAMTYHFTFSLSDVEFAIVSQTGILPKPVGVSAQVVTP